MAKSKDPPPADITFNKAALGIAGYQQMLGGFIAPSSEAELVAQKQAEEREEEEEKLGTLATKYLSRFRDKLLTNIKVEHQRTQRLDQSHMRCLFLTN